MAGRRSKTSREEVAAFQDLPEVPGRGDRSGGSLDGQRAGSRLIVQGNLSRQEAVSMIPPLFLNVEPHHRVSTSDRDSDVTDSRSVWTCVLLPAPR